MSLPEAQLNSKLTPRQESAVVALLSTATIAEAAALVGVTTRTLFRWLQDPTFQDAYRQARRESMSQTIAALQQVTSEAVDTLRKRAAGYDFEETELHVNAEGKVKKIKRSKKRLHPDVTAAVAILELVTGGANTSDAGTL